MGRSPKNHGGTPGVDFNLTGSPSDEIEPQFNGPKSFSFGFASSAFLQDSYPPLPPDPAKDPAADPPTGVQEPAFLTGVNDFHLVYFNSANGTYNLVQVGTTPGTKEFGEQFEPNFGIGNLLAFSAFLDPKNDVYKPEKITLPDGTEVAPDFHGYPVRTINLSADGIAKALTQDPGTISKTLVPGSLPKDAYEVKDAAGGASKWMPKLTPDASPAVYPVNNRYVLFVSLRGYKVADAATHYTSLWVWDTSKSPGDVGYVAKVLSVPGMSILHPKFSADGSFIAFTEADIAFGSDGKNQDYVSDPVFDIDVTEAALQTKFKSRCYLASLTIRDPADGHAVVPNLSAPVQITFYKDADGNEPRDMMPFFNSLNQIGFSSDRLDKDGNGLADGVEVDPTKAKFDIYFFQFPYDPACADETTPDSSAHRQTLGDKMVNVIPTDPTSPLVHFDDSNELHGNAAPVDFATNVLGILTPDLIYQADDAFPLKPSPNDHGWDIWETNRAGAVIPAGDAIVGTPIVTPNQSLTPEQMTDLKLTHRSGLPSDYVNIKVQVNPKYITYDAITGAPTIEVYALVKDPDNRVYDSYQSEVNPGIVAQVFDEVDAYPVKFCKTDFEDYTAKFGGKTDAPQLGALIRLTAVDKVPDPSKPIYFSGKWFTPAEVSDYMLDIIVRDAPTPAGPGPGRITDNIGGFSTAPFVSSSRVLVVSDFMSGQKSVDQTTGVFTDSGAMGESYVLDHPHGNVAWDLAGAAAPLYSVRGGNRIFGVLGPLLEWQSAPSFTGAEDPNTHRSILNNDGILNRNNPLYVASVGGNEYDLWRVQCREPITADDVKDASGKTVARGVLHNYLPYTHTQPGFPVPSVLRTQRVSDRSVMWFAPHCGDLNGNAGQNAEAFGTIANTSTQAELLSYVTRGGRLLLAGTNVAFVLSKVANNPLLARMNVAYQSDADRDEVTVFGFHRTEAHNARESNQNGLNPIPYAMWEVHWRGDSVEPVDLEFNHPLFARPHDSRADGSLTNYHMDGITPLNLGQVGGAELVYYYTNSDQGGNTLPAVISTHTPTSLTVNTSVSKTLYMAFNPDGLNRHYIARTGYYLAQNTPAMVIHNTVDFFCTGGFMGQVFVTNNVASPKNVLVYAIDDYNAEATGMLRGTAITDDNGNFSMDGLDPSVYFLYAYKTGFSMQHLVRDSVDASGDGYTVDNITLVPTQPGSLAGTVYEKGTTPHQVVVGVPVTITDIQGTVSQTSITDANGRYAFINVPTGQYIVTTPEGSFTLVVNPADPTKNEQHDYAAYSNGASALTLMTGVNPAYDIPLTRRLIPPKPGTLVVTVADVSSGTSTPAGGAVITVIDPVTKIAAVTLDLGDNPCTTQLAGAPDDGSCRFVLKAGQYDVQVAYKTATKTYKSQTKTVLVIPDDPATPDVVTKLGFEFGGVLHTFTAGSILMASLPYDYASPLTFANVLGINQKPDPLLKAIVAYDASTQGFLFYPNYPADTAHVGRGYGFKLPVDATVMEQGTTNSGTTGIIRTEIGWNLIGDPWPGTVVWNGTGTDAVRVTLRDDAAQTKMTIDDAKTKGYILSDLWGGSSVDANGNSVYSGTYQVASPTMSLSPWRAYWVKVAQPLLFYVPKPATPAGAQIKAIVEIEAMKGVLMPVADTWGLNITASAEQMTDAGLALGISRRATAGIDPGLDLAKPLPMGSADYLYTAFPMGAAGIFATDVRGLASSNTWTFNVSTTLIMRPVSITWTPMGNLPAGYSAWLVDTATGQRTNMSAVNQYAFRSARNGGVRTFRVEVRRAGVTR